MHPQRVESLSHTQRERLAYIDFRLYFMGEVGRPDLASRFGVAPAAATRDLALYREVAPQNIEFDGSNSLTEIQADHRIHRGGRADRTPIGGKAQPRGAAHLA